MAIQHKIIYISLLVSEAQHYYEHLFQKQDSTSVGAAFFLEVMKSGF